MSAILCAAEVYEVTDELFRVSHDSCFVLRQVIAKQHPKRDPRNPLINNFTFRMFMFQDMQAGDTLMITANVIGCVDAQDCAPVSSASVALRVQCSDS